uniref:(northern house mosquito) hypothetical protein n=1 Tax=Culex pipiens TaxID=7175 RepID=A0A8D8DHC5_CULPI
MGLSVFRNRHGTAGQRPDELGLGVRQGRVSNRWHRPEPPAEDLAAAGLYLQAHQGLPRSPALPVDPARVLQPGDPRAQGGDPQAETVQQQLRRAGPGRGRQQQRGRVWPEEATGVPGPADRGVPGRNRPIPRGHPRRGRYLHVRRSRHHIRRDLLDLAPSRGRTRHPGPDRRGDRPDHGRRSRPFPHHEGTQRHEVPRVLHQGRTPPLPERSVDRAQARRRLRSSGLHHPCRHDSDDRRLPAAPRPRRLPQPRQVQPGPLCAGELPRTAPVRVHPVQRRPAELHRPEVCRAGGKVDHLGRAAKVPHRSG